MDARGLIWASFLAIAAGFPAAPVVNAQEPASGLNDDMIPEIVVTARRVVENVGSVPVAITAISGDELANLLVVDTATLIEQIPGASLVTAGPGYIADTSLRGQGGGRVGSAESSTGLFRDGHYTAGGSFGGRSLNRLDLFDLERVEVLRGPQGALYGRNAVGGSINAIVRKPDFDGWGGWGKLGYDSLDTVDAQGAVNVPLAGTLAMRIAGFYTNQSSGSITNVTTGHKVDKNLANGLRAALAWRVTDKIDTRFTFENFYNRTPAYGSLGYRATRSDGTPLDPGIFERVLSSESYARIKQQTYYWDTRIVTGYGDWHINLDYKHRRGARFDEDLDHFLGFQGSVLGGTPVVMFADDVEKFENGGVQIYLTSPGSQQGWTWLVGIDGLANKSDELIINRGTATPAGLRRQFRADDSGEKLRSGAIYGSLGYDFAPRWNLGLELRVQRDRKSFVFDRSRNQPSSLAVPIFVDLEHEWTRVLPAATLRYSINEDQNAYVRFASGYRPGGFNNGIPADFPGAADLIPYGPEKVYGGELGWKASLLDGSWIVNLATYYTRTNDVQVVTAASSTNPQFILQNAGDDDIYGVEIETRGRINLGAARLDLSAALASNGGNFADGTTVIGDGGTVVDLSGLRVNRTRDLQATVGATLGFPVGEGMRASFGANLQTEHGGFENAVHTRKLANFNLLDLTASLARDRWTFLAWAKNVGDEHYILQTLTLNEFYNSRRRYGASVQYAF